MQMGRPCARTYCLAHCRARVNATSSARFSVTVFTFGVAGTLFALGTTVIWGEVSLFDNSSRHKTSTHSDL